MNIGFMIGCFISIVFWGIDRERILNAVIQRLNGSFSQRIIKIVHAIFIVAIAVLVFYVEKYVIVGNKLLEGILGVVIGILVVDMSNTDKKSIKTKGDKKYFCDTISLVSRGITCGFIGPIIYVNIFGLYFAVLYSMFYHYVLIHGAGLIKYIKNLLDIVPGALVMFCLYVVYIARYKRLYLSFNGDFIRNILFNPLLNVEILSAHVQGVGFYSYQQGKTTFIKAYGKIQRNIDKECVVNYISLAYIICLIVFVGSFIIVRV